MPHLNCLLYTRYVQSSICCNESAKAASMPHACQAQMDADYMSSAKGCSLAGNRLAASWQALEEPVVQSHPHLG